MDLRKITDTYFVSPQIDPADMAAAAAAGVTTIIDNRPDAEIPPSHHAAVMAEAAKAAGITFVHLPLTHQTMTPENMQAHADAMGEKTLAYCASGTRSAVIWALGQASAGNLSAEEILAAATSAGYDLSNIRPMLETMAQS